jgi:hypothetical protein
VYSHCLFCKSSLGANEAIEHFPIGKRLAYDATKGRLWVVCPKCARWNLTPIEERWEAIEEAERLYSGQRLRAQTENIGVAKVRDGTELVRIGPALRPEFAAWRYGREFGARLRKRAAVLGGSAAVVAGGAAVVGAPVVSAIVALGPLWMIAGHFIVPYMMLRGRLVPTTVVGENGKVLRIVRADLEHAELLGTAGDPWRLRIKHSYGRQDLTGQRARRALGALLARANRSGAATGTVRDATAVLAQAADPLVVARTIAEEARRRTGDFAEKYARHQRGDKLTRPLVDLKEPVDWEQLKNLSNEPVNRGALPRLPAPLRLALEMALHEDTERRAMEGELAILEAAWREAEEIAAIADNMFAPGLPTRRE